MSATNVYFLPSAGFEVGEFKKRIVKHLEEMLLINGYYDEKEGFFAYKSIPFEYASVHDNGIYRLIPETSCDGYGSTCCKCLKDIDGDFYETISDFYDAEGDAGEESDMRKLKLVCPNCGIVQDLSQIVFKEPVTFASQYFQFVDIDDEIDEKLLSILGERMQCDFTLLYERM